MDFLHPARERDPLYPARLTSSLSQLGVARTARDLRRLIPAETTLGLLVKAAVTGQLTQYDENGVEATASVAVDPRTRIELLRYLTDKRIPNAKPAEEDERIFDTSTLPTTIVEATQLTPTELNEAIEATFQLQNQNQPQPVPPPVLDQ